MRMCICFCLACLMVACKQVQQPSVDQSELSQADSDCLAQEVLSPFNEVLLGMRRADLRELLDIKFREIIDLSAYTEGGYAEISGSRITVGLNGDEVVSAQLYIPCNGDLMVYSLQKDGWKPMGLWSEVNRGFERSNVGTTVGDQRGR